MKTRTVANNARYLVLTLQTVCWPLLARSQKCIPLKRAVESLYAGLWNASFQDFILALAFKTWVRGVGEIT